ncbi:hypothetical protein K461DRAFT_274019 [Myriangium duriaei CBS 260.36]|uniref:Helicase C-terminal domain-containing protein n=1 Tax=Myriangium duriaei CBS 260.36 TaxID=1168546 RepID=A0A9P4JFA6_9PEZI|nr:hypothetical protein K461DRAFT_274019 [Myriangium duriaei CBS 260.36]
MASTFPPYCGHLPHSLWPEPTSSRISGLTGTPSGITRASTATVATSPATSECHSSIRTALSTSAQPSAETPEASSIATSPRTSRRVGLTNLDSSSPWHRDEARPLLRELSNFISLGCLTSASEYHSHHDALEWSEIYIIPDLPDLHMWQSGLEDLIAAGWIRVFARSGHSKLFGTVFRIYMLAGDVGHRFIDRAGRHARARHECLRQIVAAIDTSSCIWNGTDVGKSSKKFDMWASPDTSSLHWIFNNNPSPSPDISRVDNDFKSRAMDDILHQSLAVRGLKTKLYPYQRKSAACMLQRESESRQYLDPRLEPRKAPDGSTFFYCARDFLFLRHPRMYEAGKGGILAETMGLGKTVITLSLILSTRCFLPKVPIEYSVVKPASKVRSLMDMCVEAINTHGLPWKPYFEEHENITGDSMANCTERLRKSKRSYEIPREPIRFNRTTTIPPPSIKTLAPTTVVVVPRNLCSQWQSEIEKHTEPGALKVLVMEDLKQTLPTADELRQYDVILFSRNRFEQESRDGSDEQGRRFSKTPLSCSCPYIKATRKRDCTCLRTDDIYDSPLKKLHFLRIIIDEGHSFSSSTSMAATVAERLVTADHRWVVSGTPAKNLLGVEMDLYTSEQSPMPLNDRSQREKILSQRKDFSASEDAQGAVKSLGSLVTHFLQIRPWSGGQGERLTPWEDYIYRHEDARKKTFTSFSRALRQTLEAVMIKTRPEDVEKDIELPPLTHSIVKLKPSFYDKVTANLFTLVLTANAVTSERTDRDYLFHKDSAKARYELIGNLRRSAFFWTGFSRADIENTIGNSERYLEKEGIQCSIQDQLLLRRCIAIAKDILESNGWKLMSATHEFGLFLQDWPEDSAEYWTFDGTKPLLTGSTLLAEAQDHVHSRLLPDLEANLSGEGIKAMGRARARGREETQATEGPRSSELTKAGVPTSGLTGEFIRKRNSATKKGSKVPEDGTQDIAVSPLKRRVSSEMASSTSVQSADSPTPSSSQAHTPTPIPVLLSDSPLHQTRITGTVSAKMSYLLSRILALHPTEKILIFYTGGNSAYYLAQCLELLHVPHRIYARDLAAHLKSKYIVDFNLQPHLRVLLMDVHQAAYGLNVSSASRVFFVNPVFRPSIEAQAIKRAHRIGQDKPVHVETLVLQGTVEEDMWERSRRMSRAEHNAAKVLEDDGGIKDIIMHARLLDLGIEEHRGVESMAPLERAEKLWCREGWESWEGGKWLRIKEEGKKRKRSAVKVEDGDGGEGSATPKAKKKRRVGFADHDV